MHRYNNYKETGIKWLGKIPLQWEISRIKAVTQLKIVKNKPNERLLSIYREHGVVYKDSRSDNHNVESEDLTNYKYVEPNNLVINKMKAWQGSLAISGYRGIISPAYIICSVNEKKVFPRFLHYLLRSHGYIAAYNSISYGVRVGQWDMRYDDFRNLPLLLPPYQVQKDIVSFLDNKTKEIQQLIETKKVMIGELEKYKRSFITKYVTKGLNKNHEYVKSKIEWIGEVPKNWGVEPLFSVMNKKLVKNTNNVEQNVLSLSYGKIKKRNVETNFGLLPDSFETYQIVDVNDIVLRLTDLQNDKKSLRVGLVKEKGIITSAYVCLNIKEKLNPEYAYYLLHSYDLQKVFYGLGAGVRQSMKFEDLRKIPLLIPPHSEQKEIVNYLETKVNNIEKSIDILQMQIGKLNYYQKALITKIVTGKLSISENATGEGIADANRYVRTRD